MKDVQKIKKLRSQLANLQGDKEAILVELSLKRNELNHKIGQIKKLEKLIKKLDCKKELKVSEHAILRYFERVMGVDIQMIERRILSDKIFEYVEKLGPNGTYPNDGHSVVMKDGTVTTITT
jgi:hypothetical protein